MQQEPIQVNTAYIWQVVYEDGSGLTEYERNEETGQAHYHSFHDVDLSRCLVVILHSVTPERQDVSLRLDSTRNQRPIFFRKGHILLKFSELNGNIPTDPIPQEFQGHTHCIGFQETVVIQGEKRNVSCYLYVFPDGSQLLSPLTLEEIEALSHKET